MILNGYAILLLLLNFIRLPLALLVAILGISAVWQFPRRLQPEQRAPLEGRAYLLMMVALWLVGLNVLSWPLFYWLLQSYVPEWPDVMCIYGVTQIGTGSLGTSRFLPGLIATVQLLKPLLLFLCGSWFVLYWVNRYTETAVLLRRVIVASLLVGLVSVADASLEASYVVIPKREDLPSVGCCTMNVAPRSAAFSATGSLHNAEDGWLLPSYYGVNTLMIAALAVQLAIPRRQMSNLELASLLVGMLVAAAISYHFLVQVASPRILHLPHHRCAYDLISLAPESVVGIVLFVLGSLAIGWACVVAWFGHHTATGHLVEQVRSKVLFLALFGYLSSLTLFSIELALNVA